MFKYYYNEFYFQIFTDGITNKLIGVWYSEYYNEMVLVRVYGHKTDLLINRKDETRNIRVSTIIRKNKSKNICICIWSDLFFKQILNKAGFTHSIYATFNNGLAYQFIEGNILTTETVRNPDVYVLIAKRMAQMHRLKPDIEMSKEACIWKKLEKFMEIMPKEFSNITKQAR